MAQLRLFVVSNRFTDIVIAAPNSDVAMKKAKTRTGRTFTAAALIGIATKGAYSGQVFAGARSLQQAALGFAFEMLEAACKALDVDPADALLVKSPACMTARWAVWHVLRTDHDLSLPAIARAFHTAANPYNHTTVLHALRRIPELLAAGDASLVLAIAAARHAFEAIAPEARKEPQPPLESRAKRPARAAHADQEGQPRATRQAPRAELPAPRP